MKLLSFLSALLLFSSQPSCTSVEDDEGPIPSAKRAASEAAAQQGQNPGSLPQSDPFALKEQEPIRLRFKDDLFQFQANTEQFTNASKNKVKALGKILTASQESWERMEIRGHSDAKTKNPERNQELSEMRAKAVLNVFADAGLESSRMSSEGVGSSEPLPGKDPNAAENRRVEIILFGTSPEAEFLSKLQKYVVPTE